jgi:hypothetical protein
MSAPYVIKKNAAVWWPVRWLEPVDGGGVVERQIEMKFRRVGIAEFQAIRDAADSEDNLAFFQKVAIDWRGVADEDGPLAFTAANLARMADIQGWPEAVGLAFARCFSAQAETREGNSAGSPAGGQAAAAPASTAAADGPA